MIPSLMFGSISGCHINPAMTLGLVAVGMFPWAEVVAYILFQFLGAIAGQLIIVAVFKPHYDLTTDPQKILGTFSTIAATLLYKSFFLN